MAVQDDSQNNGENQTAMGAAFGRARPAQDAGASTTPPGSQPRGGQQQPNANAPRPGAFSFRNLGSMVSTPMGRNQAGEVLTKLKKALDAQYENVNQRFEMTTIPVDMNDTATLTTSVLIICARERNNKDSGVAYHTLILEGSTEPPPSKLVPINGQQVEVLVTLSDANNDVLQKEVVDRVAQAFPQSRVHNADTEVVPRDFKVEDEGLVYALAANAAYACGIELTQKNPNFVDINLANATGGDVLTVRTAFPRDQIVNSVGLPIRRSTTIDLQASPGGNQQQQMMERTVAISRISGYMDLIWAPTNPPMNQFNPFPQAMTPQMQALQHQRYVPRFVMTMMETIPAPTLACQLLALAMAASLNENNQWVRAFTPMSYANGEIDLHDIGAVGIEANFDNPTGLYGSRVNTRGDNFKITDLAKLVGATIKQGLVLSLDVEECGPSTWINGVFAAAAEGNDKANQLILEAASYLTNGNFDKYFPANGRVAVDENNRIHLGYFFPDNSGVRHDLREIDYLAVLNLMGEKDPEVVRDWSDTYEQIQFPLEQRLAARLRIMRSLFPSVTVTGFARRVSFEGAFVDALLKGCEDCKLNVKSVQPYADTASFDRATSQFAQHTILPSTSSGVFNRGMAFQGGPQGGASRSFMGGRWF